MNENIALIVCQLLLVRAGSRIKLKRVATAGSGAYLFKAFGRRTGKRVVMPVIGTRSDSLPVLSVLDETGALSWMCNGQVISGGRQLAHFGDCGRAVVMQPKSYLRELYGNDLIDNEKLQRRVDFAPDELSLLMRDEFDQDVWFVLPTADEAEWLVRALGNEPVSIGFAVEDRLKSMIDTFGLSLNIVPDNEHGKLLISKEWIKVKSAA